MAKNLLSESTVRQFMKLANLGKHADDVVSKFGLLKEGAEGAEEESEGSEESEPEESEEGDDEETAPMAPEEAEIDLDAVESNEGDDEVDVTMQDLKDFISQTIKDSLQELVGSGMVSVEGDVGAEGEVPPAELPAPEMGAEMPPEAAPAPEAEMGAEEEEVPAPVMEAKSAGLASKGTQGKGTFDGAKQKATVTKTGKAGLASKGTKAALEESDDSDSDDEVLEEEQVDEAFSLDAYKGGAKGIKGAVAQAKKEKNLKKVGMTPEQSAEFKAKLGVKSKSDKKGGVTESRKTMMEAYIARYGKEQLIKEVSKRVAKRLAEAKEAAQKKG